MSTAKRIGAIIQGRMQSSRMPGKVLLPLPFPGGRPLLQCVTDELKQSKLISQVYLATSTNTENQALEQFAAQQHIACFRGDEDDVLSRFLHIAKADRLDIVIRLTADNPFVDIDLLDNAIQQHISSGNDYTKSTGLPLGMNFEIVSASALTSLENMELAPEDREHVTLHIRNSGKFKTAEVHLGDISLQHLRLTVDYPSDFAVASLLYGLLQPGEHPGICFVERIWQAYPWIFSVNGNNIQKQQYTHVQDEIDAAYKLLDSLDMKNAAHLLKNMEEAG